MRKRSLRWWRRDAVLPAALLAIPIGVLAALVTNLFRMSIDFLDTTLLGSQADITVHFAQLPVEWRLLLPALGALVAGLLLWWDRRLPVESGNNDYMDAVAEGDGRIPLRSSILRSLSSLSSIVTGGSIGREGAMVQLAALSGSLTGRRWADLTTLRLCTACGAAAGLASVYHTPLAGAMFVAEVVLGSITVEGLIPLFASAAAATFTMHALGNGGAPFALVQRAPVFDGLDLMLLLPIGIMAGLLGPPFLMLLARSRRLFAALPWPLPLRMAFGGLLMGAITIVVPEVCGNGYAPILSILHDASMSVPVAWVLVAKITATLLIVGSGAVGGIFTPSLFIGAALGSVIAGAAQFLPLSGHADTALLALVGMGAFMAAVSRAPLMAILMVFEMTMDATLLLPLMCGSVVAYAVSSLLPVPSSLYSVLDRRRLKLSEIREYEGTPLAALVRPPTQTLTPDDTLSDALENFRRGRRRYLHVIDAQGRFVGALSLHRVYDVLYRTPAASSSPVRDYVEADFLVLPADRTLAQAWDVLTQHPIEWLPVVDDLRQRHMLGVISRREILSHANELRR
ncbi:ClcB-like voltage-gated chloride channel protein [Solimonas sp. C16B3]|uniref:ClcB-like voltage-gated chloride channel protein n=1 Tax=Solimonas marina TaxID=2714601 RepID=A0A969WAF9_9GAMM|nr:ClcB-like voltage-gated chloride channel protein [Solimonas marina]